MYGYYNGIFHAGCSIWKEQGPKGLYAGYVLMLMHCLQKLFHCIILIENLLFPFFSLGSLAVIGLH